MEQLPQGFKTLNQIADVRSRPARGVLVGNDNPVNEIDGRTTCVAARRSTTGPQQQLHAGSLPAHLLDKVSVVDDVCTGKDALVD